MGAGVALAIAKAYPAAKQADQQTKNGDISKLGGFSKATQNNKTIYNLYGQYYYGTKNGPAIDYAALEKALAGMAADLLASGYDGEIALPRLGCGLAGGRWSKVEPLIIKHLSHWPVTIYSL